ncbi:hypothetical protein TNCV_3948771 [Trichonephila clavipes]|nr:hypothetical protein TNCV_3948771 [Trichonephila clavipes]
MPNPPVEPEKLVEWYPDPFSSFHVQRLDLGKRRMEPPLAPKRLKQEPSEGSNNIILWVPRHHPLMQLGNNGFIIQPTNVNGINK